MTGYTFDSGALVAAEKGDARFWADWKALRQARIVPTVPAAVLAQVWRDGARQARLSTVLKGCRVESLSEGRARRVGELCGLGGVADTTDAAVVLGAAQRGDDVLTSDPGDLRALADACAAEVTIRVL